MMRRLAVPAVATALLAAACGSTLQPEDPALVLKQGGAAIGKIHSVTATMKVTKGTISFQGFSLVSASAQIRVPGESDTVYTVRQQDIQLALEVVVVGGRYFLKPPLLAFTELTRAQAAEIPDLAHLFDPNTGLSAVIPQGSAPKSLGVETIDDVQSYKVSATYSAAQIQALLPQLGSQGPVDATVWVGGSDHLIRKAVLAGKFGSAGADSVVEIGLSGFNGSVAITSPPVAPSPSVAPSQ